MKKIIGCFLFLSMLVTFSTAYTKTITCTITKYVDNDIIEALNIEPASLVLKCDKVDSEKFKEGTKVKLKIIKDKKAIEGC